MLPSLVSFFLSFLQLFGFGIPTHLAVPTPPPAIVIVSSLPTIRTSPSVKPSISPSPTIKPSVVPTPTVTPTSSPSPVQNTMEVTPQSLLTALDNYRTKNGKGSLAWDDKLGKYAQERANTFKATGNIDNHVRFNNFISTQNGFAVLGFNALGENSSIGGTTSAQAVIEKLYAISSFHNQNMLSTDWSHVGIGVAGICTDFVFGGRKR